ncbi:bath-40 [Symbiodinium sp. KB8]|nr:bath-40 [Symbiodinium sp. KB8]
MKARDVQRGMGLNRPLGPVVSYDTDVFNSLFEDYLEMRPSAPFFGFFLQVIFGPRGWNFCSRNKEPLEEYFSNREAFSLTADSISWVLPYESVYLKGLSFAKDMPKQVHCQVFCSQDGIGWHLAADSGKSKIEAKTLLPLNRPSYLVKWFKLEVCLGGRLPQQLACGRHPQSRSALINGPESRSYMPLLSRL